MPVRLNGSTSGYTELSAPAVAGNNRIALPTGNGSTYQIVRNSGTAGSLEFADKIVSGTAQNSTSGTSIDFTGIPSWVKRITVMYYQVSTSGTSTMYIRVGSGSIVTTGYKGGSTNFDVSSLGTNLQTSGFQLNNGGASASASISGSFVLTNLTANIWTGYGACFNDDAARTSYTGGGISLAGVLDRVRITTVNGTDTFDAGSINILWE